MSDFTTELLSTTARIAVSNRMIQLKPTRLLVLPQGSINDEPSFGLFLSTGNGEEVVVTQLSLRMLLESMDVKTFTLLKNYSARIIR